MVGKGRDRKGMRKKGGKRRRREGRRCISVKKQNTELKVRQKEWEKGGVV